MRNYFLFSFLSMFTIALCLPSTPMVEDAVAAGPRCTSQRLAFSSAQKVERSAQQKFNQAQRNADSLSRRADQALQKVENYQTSCQNRVDNKNQALRHRLDNFEARRQDYIAKIEVLTLQAAECIPIVSDFFGTGNGCKPATKQRLLDQANRLAAQVTKVELQIAQVRDQNSRDLANIQRQCDRQLAQYNTALTRARDRMTTAVNAIPPFQATLDRATAARQTAETAYNTCLGQP